MGRQFIRLRPKNLNIAPRIRQGTIPGALRHYLQEQQLQVREVLQRRLQELRDHLD